MDRIQEVTLDVLYDGTDYKPRPRLRYEIAEGVMGVMRPVVVAVQRKNERLAKRLQDLTTEEAQQLGPDDELHYTNVFLQRARWALQVPDDFDWNDEAVYFDMVRRVHRDFLFLCEGIGDARQLWSMLSQSPEGREALRALQPDGPLNGEAETEASPASSQTSVDTTPSASGGTSAS